MKKVNRADEPPLGIGRAILLVAIAGSSSHLIFSTSSNVPLRCLGAIGYIATIVGVIALIADRQRYARLVRPQRATGHGTRPTWLDDVHHFPSSQAAPGQPQHGQPVTDRYAELRRQSPVVANHLIKATGLLSGPLREHLDPTQIANAEKAITESLNDLDTLAADERSGESALETLRASLRKSRLDPEKDPEFLALQAHLTDLTTRRSALIAELDRSVTGITATWAPIAAAARQQAHQQELSAARNAAEQEAGHVAAGTDAAHHLSDAADDIAARLRGVQEVDSINDEFLGNDNLTPPMNLRKDRQ